MRTGPLRMMAALKERFVWRNSLVHRLLAALVAGAFAELEKARLVAKLRGARERKRAESKRVTIDGRGKCEGRKSLGERSLNW